MHTCNFMQIPHREYIASLYACVTIAALITLTTLAALIFCNMVLHWNIDRNCLFYSDNWTYIRYNKINVDWFGGEHGEMVPWPRRQC